MEQDFETTTQVILEVDFKSTPKVLLVDDDELVRAQLQAAISAAGFKVEAVADGAAALAAMEKEFAPVVITDRNMPGMDGLALCRAIRERRFPGYVYMLLLTAHDREEDILAGLEAGADDYLSKRASSAQLLARLRTAQRILGLERSLKDALAEKRQLAMTDALTGAHNRRYFMRRLNGEIQRAQRVGGELSILALDIDHFKSINDRYGHAAGDAVLREFVRRIDENLPRRTDWCARIGGEEFTVVLEGTDLTGAAKVAERLRAATADTPMPSDTGLIPTTVSIGVATLKMSPGKGQASVESLLGMADDCLYASKENGRNRVTLPEPSNSSSDE